ncbi:MAG: lytic transglycosylase domain-containing protein, partial [Pseudomonadota bacterium]
AELLAVPIVESGYKKNALSSAKAAGIWQFIPQTARRCGLEVSKKNDERLNPKRLTQAAVCYYQKLHAIFQDWHVAIAAYNVGERRMMNVIADASHNDVLKLSREGLLGQEGGNYLPKVIAGMIIMKNPELIE